MKDSVSLLERNPQMKLWPALAPYASEFPLAGGRDRLFLYDTAPADREKQRLVFIHGLGDEADSWRSLIPLLSDGWRILAPDLPGFGRSTARARISLAGHVAAIVGLLKETGPAVLVGSSMGAVIAELVAFEVPEEATALVLLDGGLPAGGALSLDTLRMLTPALGERAYRAFRRDHEAAYRSLEPYYADLNALPETELDFLRDRVIARVESETQLRAYFGSLRSFVATAAFRGSLHRRKLASYGGPVLIGWGEHDRIMPIAAAEVLKSIRSDAELRIFSGAGHLPHQEKPAAVAEAIAAFIASTSSRRA
jgi:pimeloyl-ACP methyl ester carboxylesterase